MGRDHNATSYSTETEESWRDVPGYRTAEIITLRAIALKLLLRNDGRGTTSRRRDHNATSYSTETSCGI